MAPHAAAPEPRRRWITRHEPPPPQVAALAGAVLEALDEAHLVLRQEDRAGARATVDLADKWWPTPEEIRSHLPDIIRLAILTHSANSRNHHKNVAGLAETTEQHAPLRAALHTMAGIAAYRDGMDRKPHDSKEVYAEFVLSQLANRSRGKPPEEYDIHISACAAAVREKSLPIGAEEFHALLIGHGVPILRGPLVFLITLPIFVHFGIVDGADAAGYLPPEFTASAGSVAYFRSTGGDPRVFREHVLQLRATRLQHVWALDIENVFCKLHVVAPRLRAAVPP